MSDTLNTLPDDTRVDQHASGSPASRSHALLAAEGRALSLAELVREAGETGNFTTFDGASVLDLGCVEASWAWRRTLDVGAHVPLHGTASDKLFNAFMPARLRRTPIAGLSFSRMTERTLVTVSALEAGCKEVAQRGCLLDNDEFITGQLAVAVPVGGAQGAVRAALAGHAPKAHLPAMTAVPERMCGLL